MSRFTFTAGHVEGSSQKPRLCYEQAETCGKGLLLFLGCCGAALGALGSLYYSLTHK